jgi:hypothetical protein
LSIDAKCQYRNLTRHDALPLQREPGAVTLTSMFSPGAAEPDSLVFEVKAG